MAKADEVSRILTRLTGAPFEVTNPHPDDQINKERQVWLVSYTDASYAGKVPHVQRAWENQQGQLTLESVKLGDTIDWIESAYGEEAAGRSLDIDYSDFATKEFQANFGVEYPRVFHRIQTYEETARRVSENRKVDIELREEGSKGIVVFSFVAKVSGAGEKALSKALENNVEALREAWQQAAMM